MSGNLSIGELARWTGVKVETIRYYERDGIMPPPPRAENGYRVYPPALQGRLYFVKRARELGFTLAQIRTLLRLVDGGEYSCGEIYDIASSHLDEVRRKIADLRRIETVLDAMVADCSGGDIPECAIVESLWPAGH